jgi:hypothetical protein
VRVDYVNEHDIDLVVMGKRGRSDPDKPLFGTITNRVVGSVDVLVFTSLPLHLQASASAERGDTGPQLRVQAQSGDGGRQLRACPVMLTSSLGVVCASSRTRSVEVCESCMGV